MKNALHQQGILSIGKSISRSGRILDLPLL